MVKRLLSDIAMCYGDGCPYKDRCYRFVVKPSVYWKTHFVITPYDKVKNKCDYFYPLSAYIVSDKVV